MAAPVLTRAELNRATLARQLLLGAPAAAGGGARGDVAVFGGGASGGAGGVVAAVEQLGGLQAQEPRPPFVALGARLAGFEPEGLRDALRERRIVRATLMRSTLHLMSAADYLALRAALQAPPSVALRVLGARARGLDPERVVAAARELLAAGPLTFDEIRAGLAARFEAVDERALGYAARTLLALVMVPGDEPHGYPRAARFALPAQLLGADPAPADPRRLAERHLGAFGPASAADVQAWAGVGGMRAVLDSMRDRLQTFSDERGRELFDLPGAPRPGADVPAPPRLLAEFDSLLLAHADRTRVIDDEHRPLVTTRNLRVRATFLVDGRVAGTWTLERRARAATLRLAPFARLPAGVRRPLRAEAERVALLAAPDARGCEVAID